MFEGFGGGRHRRPHVAAASSALVATLYAASHTATALSSIALAAAASLPTATLAWTALVWTSRVLACVDRFVWTVVWTVV